MIQHNLIIYKKNKNHAYKLFCLHINAILHPFKIFPKNYDFYIESLTHKSYSNENNLNYSYQRQEILGDSILNYLSTEYLLNKYKDENEGFISEKKAIIIKNDTLFKISQKLNLSDLLLLGNGENNAGTSHNIKIQADIYESFIGAIYLDQGLAKTNQFINDTLFAYINTNNILNIFNNYKSMIQEYFQSYGHHIKYVEKNYIKDKKMYIINLIVDQKIYGVGSGKTKKEAETNAAKEAYFKIAEIIGE